MCTLRLSISDMISLNVRTKRSRNDELPATLYQGMPEKGMALIATMPSGAAAVSIPGKSGPGGGYAILKDGPPSGAGLVVAYDRRQNGRYEAAAALYHGRIFEFAEFIPIARQWVEKHFGMPKEIPGCYACFSPTREEWGVILRDSGYLAWDPSGMPFGVTPELRARLQAREGSGILARMQVYAGDKKKHADILPVFARVQVMLESSTGVEPDWVSFAEYQKIRADRARLPKAIIPEFHEWLKSLTEDSGFKCWIFRRGMLFGDHVEWWGDRCRRRTEHEGLDFATGLLPGGQISPVQEGVPVRSMAEGEVVAVLDDFIGKTVVVRHPEFSRSDNCVFHSLLSHIRPQVSLLDRVSKGQVVGTVGKSTSAGAPSHLHLTGAWIPATFDLNEIRMDQIHPAFEPIMLVSFKDPLQGSSYCSVEPSEGEPAE